MTVRKTIAVSPVWSGHPVGFDLLTHRDRQFIAFYDAERKMTVGQRRLEQDAFEFVRLEGVWLEARGRLSTEIAWDSHNSLTMAIDRTGHIHLCGNMHVDPLIYFRTAQPLDITTFERIDHMVGRNEERCTYPVFIQGPQDALETDAAPGDAAPLVFYFRDGQSGNGVDYYNRYDESTRSWSRLVDTPILDGMDAMNAYARKPEPGPDGYYHMVWMWRDTPDCATNHDISYARSRDLVQWEAGNGTALALPITIEDRATIVDPSPPGGGLINMCQSLGFDSQQRPIVSYHKHDENGHTQAYAARVEDEMWQIRQLSDWKYHWGFHGNGSVAAEIQVGGAAARDDGHLAMSWWHLKQGSGIWRLDEKTLRIVGSYPEPAPDLPDELLQPQLYYPDMEVHARRARGDAGAERCVLVWETLPRNRDQPRDQIPPPSNLRLYILAE